MIELTDIAYVRSGAADLGTAVDFATRIVGLQQVDGGEPGCRTGSATVPA